MDLNKKNTTLAANSVLLIIIAVLLTVMMLAGCNNWVSRPGPSVLGGEDDDFPGWETPTREPGGEQGTTPVEPTYPAGSVDYSKLKLNEVSGVGNDSEKFYELINTGAKDIPLEDCKIYYNANGSTNGEFPPTGNQGLTWTGSADQIAYAGQLFSLIGRGEEGSFSTGLTAQRILIITLEDPAGNVIDQCVRAADTGDYAFTNKSFSRIPDGTGDFYFTEPTPSEINGTLTTGLTKVPVEPPVVVTPPVTPPTTPSTEGLMILQVFGMHANNDSAPTHSFIELYNNSNAAIPLNTFSVHWANGLSTNNNAPAEKDVWHRINLTGSIPAKSSYLILGPQVVTTFSGTNGRLDLSTTTADLVSSTFLMSNRSYKVALMSNQADLALANPWGDAACIDLVSAINTAGTDSVNAAKGATDLNAVNGASGGANTISKQKSFRRKSLTVSNVTLTDFTSQQYSTLNDSDIAKFRPRNSAAGSYTPQF
jgi:hypothetical protein